MGGAALPSSLCISIAPSHDVSLFKTPFLHFLKIKTEPIGGRFWNYKDAAWSRTDYALITDVPARGPATYLSFDATFLLLSSFAPLRLICGYLKRSMKIIEENRIMGKIADLIQLDSRIPD